MDEDQRYVKYKGFIDSTYTDPRLFPHHLANLQSKAIKITNKGIRNESNKRELTSHELIRYFEVDRRNSIIEETRK